MTAARAVRTVGRHAVLIAVAVAFVLPLLVALRTAVIGERRVFTDAWWPHPWDWSSFADAFRDQPLLRMAWNTTLIAVVSTTGVLLSSIPAAYALARLRWRGRSAALLLVIAVFLLPPQVAVIAVYEGWAHLHLIGSYAPLLVPGFLGDAFAIFLLRQFFLTVPEAMLDACRLEGAGEWQVLWRVVLPMTRQGVAAVALLELIGSWNDFFNPYLYLGQNPERWTLSIGLAQFREVHHVEWNTTMAAALLVALPMVVLFLLAQRIIIDSVAAEAPA
jgi:multiple sugar transport system permease protein